MIAHGSKNYSIPISLLALVVGFLLMISGYVPFGVLGGGLILLSFLLPFLRLGIKPNPPVVPSEHPTKTEKDVTSSPLAVARRKEDVR